MHTERDAAVLANGVTNSINSVLHTTDSLDHISRTQWDMHTERDAAALANEVVECCICRCCSVFVQCSVQCVVVVAMCCSVLQCVAVCCSVLHCVAVCCSVLQCVAVCCSVLLLKAREPLRFSSSDMDSDVFYRVAVCSIWGNFG